jgi:hypothetical protein
MKQKPTINNITRFDPNILHNLPFLPSKIRQKTFRITRTFGTQKLTLTAFETINHLDLLTLFQLVKDYIMNKSNYVEAGKLEDFEVLQGQINLEKIVKERNLKNQKTNRKTIWDSIYRFQNVNVELSYTDSRKVVRTKYIFQSETDNDNDLYNCKIFINKKFFDFCVQSGIVLEIEKLFRYKSAYTILLDVFIQSTKWNNYKEELLFERIGLNDSNLAKKEKRRILKKTFREFNDFNNFDFYHENNKWKTAKMNTPTARMNTPTARMNTPTARMNTPSRPQRLRG